MKPIIAAILLLLSTSVAQLSAQQRIVDEASSCRVEIDTSAFDRNITELEHLLGSETILCAVIKANAYGCGIKELMPTIIRRQIPYLGVTANSEARVARNMGYQGKIMRIRTATPAEIEDALKYDVEELIGNIALARIADSIALAHKDTILFHISLNSGGMSRNGFEMNDLSIREDVLQSVALPSLKVVGIMTHFPTWDYAEIRSSLQSFNEEAEWIIKNGHLNRDEVILHTANSFTAIHIPEARLDLARIGEAFYGMGVENNVDGVCHFEAIMSFKSEVASVNSYKKGESVGYDRTYLLKRDSRLANLPIGYANGFSTGFANKGFVLIKGHRVPIVGKVSMNTTMADVTDFPDITISDEVVIFGSQGSQTITIQEVEEYSSMNIFNCFTLWGTINPIVVK